MGEVNQGEEAGMSYDMQDYYADHYDEILGEYIKSHNDEATELILNISTEHFQEDMKVFGAKVDAWYLENWQDIVPLPNEDLGSDR